MDFVSHKPKANADPLASRPASRPIAKPKPVAKVHSVSDQIPPKGTHISTPKPAAKPAPKQPEITVKKTEQKPYISREPAKSRDLYPDDNLALKASAALSGTSKPAEKPSAPDNNAYSLGGKSPFLPNAVVNKRPLSDSVPAKKKDTNFEKLSFLGVSEEPSHKNVYEKKSDLPAKSSTTKKEKSVRIIDDTKKKHGVPVFVVILVTILLGAAVGAGVYFLLPK